jgi:hypothetical protein
MDVLQAVFERDNVLRERQQEALTVTMRDTSAQLQRVHDAMLAQAERQMSAFSRHVLEIQSTCTPTPVPSLPSPPPSETDSLLRRLISEVTRFSDSTALTINAIRDRSPPSSAGMVREVCDSFTDMTKRLIEDHRSQRLEWTEYAQGLYLKSPPTDSQGGAQAAPVRETEADSQSHQMFLQLFNVLGNSFEKTVTCLTNANAALGTVTEYNQLSWNRLLEHANASQQTFLTSFSTVLQQVQQAAPRPNQEVDIMLRRVVEDLAAVRENVVKIPRPLRIMPPPPQAHVVIEQIEEPADGRQSLITLSVSRASVDSSTSERELRRRSSSKAHRAESQPGDASVAEQAASRAASPVPRDPSTEL